MVIYQALNKINGKMYVGQTTVNLESRIRLHTQRYHEQVCNRAIRKHGIESFEWSVIDTADSRGELDKKEIYWIAHLNTISPNGYNMTTGGYGGGGNWHKGRQRSEETRKKMSESKKGKPNGREGKPSPLKGKHYWSEEAKRKLSESTMRRPSNNPNGMRGMHHSEETKARLAVLRSGSGNGNFGKSMSEEQKGMISRSVKKFNEMRMARDGQAPTKQGA